MKRAPASQLAKHELQILSLGHFLSARCSCGRWAHSFTTGLGSTPLDKRQRLESAFAEHLAELTTD